MGVVTGSIKVETSEEDLAFSEDGDVVAGERREGCGWCPPDEFDKAAVQDGADILTVRTLNDKERTRYRDTYARLGPASANVYAVTTTLRVAQVKDKKTGKVKRLEGQKAVEYAQVLAQTQAIATDLLADRIVHRTDGHGVVEQSFLDSCRRLLGYAPFVAEEVPRPEDGDDKSGEAAS